MAGWRNNEDITRDLDTLSGIRSPQGRARSYLSCGRGQSFTPERADTPPEPQEKKPEEKFEWFPQDSGFNGVFPDRAGRGRKLEILRENLNRSKGLEVHEQLRAAIGPGYSNDYIEATYKQRLKNLHRDHSNSSVDKFEDAEIKNPAHPTSSYNYTEKSVDKSGTVTSEPSESASWSHADIPKKIKTSRRKHRQYRNAVLDSLQKSNQDEVASISTKQTVSMFGNKITNIPPAGYFPRESDSITFSPKRQNNTSKRNDNSFEYNQAEFPEL